MSEETSEASKTTLYPTIEPYQFGWLDVSDGHEIYYEECGNSEGNPVIFVHGGPGGGCSSNCRRFFDPLAYRIILFDQRGAGRSKPLGKLEANTTWHLVEDMEKLRKHLGVDRWVVFGGSWGSTLSLAYAIKHPQCVKALVLRGIYTIRREEVLWLNQEGTSHYFPDHYEDYVAPIPQCERGDIVGAYYRRLTGDDEELQVECARSWAKWEFSVSKLFPDLTQMSLRLSNSGWVRAFARIECHYMIHGGWMEEDGFLLNNVDAIRHIPATIVNGRYDMVTPIKTAWELHKSWPEADFIIVPDAGHSMMEVGLTAALIAATDKYKNL